MSRVKNLIDFNLTEEQELLKKSVKGWCEKNLPLDRIREFDNKQEIPQAIIKGMGELGILLPTVPKEHGGAGLDWVAACLIAEQIGYADVTIAIPAGFQVVGGGWGFVIDEYCTEMVREEAIRPAIKGEKFIGVATTEPGGGSDVAAIKTTARKEGNKWILNGEKTFLSGTEEAKRMGGGYFLLARTAPVQPKAPHRGMTAFYLPIDARGVEVAKRFEKMGRMALSTGGLRMVDVELSDEYRLGEEGRGFYYTMEGFDCARLILSASSLGVTQRVLEIGMDYIKTREAFGRPIAKFEGIQFELADLWAELEATRALVYKTAWMQDKRYRERAFSPLEVSKWVSMCKLKAPQLALRASEKAMLWMGALGYTKEYPLEMAYRGVMSYCIGTEGTLNIQRIIIARELLGEEFVPYK